MNRKNCGPDITCNAKDALLDKACILVVDDQENLLQILSRMLTAAGFEVHTASNGFQAFRLFSRASIALVLTDFNMPGMDGLALADKIKRASPDTPVIMMTGADGPELKKLKENGFVACLLKKPFRWEDLNGAVTNALAGRPAPAMQRLMPNASIAEGQYRIQPIPNFSGKPYPFLKGSIFRNRLEPLNH